MKASLRFKESQNLLRPVSQSSYRGTCETHESFQLLCPSTRCFVVGHRIERVVGIGRPLSIQFVIGVSLFEAVTGILEVYAKNCELERDLGEVFENDSFDSLIPWCREVEEAVTDRNVSALGCSERLITARSTIFVSL